MNPDKGFSGSGFELIAGLQVELGLERVDLVGGDGRDDVNEGVDDGSMLGQIEGRELLDVANVGHVPGLEQGFILRRYGQRLHVPADAGEQRQTQQVFGQLLADIALVAEQLADQVSAGTGVVSLPGVSFKATISLSLLKTRCSLKPKNQPILPRWARPANAGQCDDCRKGGGIDVVESGPQVTVQEEHQRHEDTFLQGDEVLIAGHAGKVASGSAKP